MIDIDKKLQKLNDSGHMPRHTHENPNHGKLPFGSQWKFIYLNFTSIDEQQSWFHRSSLVKPGRREDSKRNLDNLSESSVEIKSDNSVSVSDDMDENNDRDINTSLYNSLFEGKISISS